MKKGGIRRMKECHLVAMKKIAKATTLRIGGGNLHYK